MAESFFEQLDGLLPADRGPHGEPSATDFLVIDLPSVVDEFSTSFDVLPEVIPGVPSARMLIRVGRLVDRFVVFGLEASDGSIDLIGLDLDIVALGPSSGRCNAPAAHGTRLSTERRQADEARTISVCSTSWLRCELARPRCP